MEVAIQTMAMVLQVIRRTAKLDKSVRLCKGKSSSKTRHSAVLRSI